MKRDTSLEVPPVREHRKMPKALLEKLGEVLKALGQCVDRLVRECWAEEASRLFDLRHSLEHSTIRIGSLLEADLLENANRQEGRSTYECLERVAQDVTKLICMPGKMELPRKLLALDGICRCLGSLATNWPMPPAPESAGIPRLSRHG